jgi:hypothetical protein
MTDTQTTTPTLVFVEHVLWQPGAVWRAALDHVADRFARAAPLDVDAILAEPTFARQVDALAGWAQGASVDLDQQLGRWFDEHLSMHVRPTPVVTRAIRSLAATGDVHFVSALPARPAESIVRHVGCWRSAASLVGDARSADDIDAIVERVGAERIVADESASLPQRMSPTSLT